MEIYNINEMIREGSSLPKSTMSWYALVRYWQEKKNEKSNLILPNKWKMCHGQY